MNTQSEALRLADWCDAHSSGEYRPSAAAAAELRRLDEIEKEYKRLQQTSYQINALRNENEILKERNKELLEALLTGARMAKSLRHRSW